MSSITKKIQENKDKQLLKDAWGKEPKHRCPNCHRFTLWHKDKNKKPICHWCKK